MPYSDQDMLNLAVNYLRNVGELPRHNIDHKSLLTHCINVYNKRKTEGLEIDYKEEENKDVENITSI